MTKADQPPTDDERRRPHRTRRALLIAGAAVAVAAILAVVAVAAIRGEQNAQADASKNTRFTIPAPDTNSPPPPTAPPASDKAKSGASTPAPKVDAAYGAPVAAVVHKSDKATLTGGLTAQMTVTPTTVSAVRAGETAGPAIKVELSISNPGGSAVAMSELAVNAYYGSASTPAVEMSDGAQPILGTLKAGETRHGVYYFSVPSTQASSAVVTVTDAAGAPVTVFK